MRSPSRSHLLVVGVDELGDHVAVAVAGVRAGADGHDLIGVDHELLGHPSSDERRVTF